MQNTIDSVEQQIDKMWLELLTKNPTQEHLWQLVRLVPHLRERAWNEFLKKNPDKGTLIRLMTEYNSSWVKTYPCRRIIECFLDKDMLEMIVVNVSELASEAALKAIANPENKILVLILSKIDDPTICEKAGQALLKLSPTQDELIAIVIGGTSGSKKQAAQMLLENEKLPVNAITSILYEVPELAVRVWNKYKPTMGNYPLEFIVSMKPHLPFRIEAAQMLLGRSKEFSELFALLQHVPELREETWKKLSSMKLPENWLIAIKRDVPELASRIEPLLEMLEGERKSRPQTAGDIFWEIQNLYLKSKKNPGTFE